MSKLMHFVNALLVAIEVRGRNMNCINRFIKSHIVLET